MYSHLQEGTTTVEVVILESNVVLVIIALARATDISWVEVERVENVVRLRALTTSPSMLK